MALLTTVKPRNIDITGDYVVNSISASGNVSANNIKSDHLLYANGSPYVFTTNAAGTNTQVQFNDGNSFAGSANLTFDKTSGTLTVAYLSGDGSNVANVNAKSLNGHSDTYFASTTYVDNAVANLVNSAPSALDTLNELANALGNDASFSTSITNSLANKLSVSAFNSTANTWISTQTTSNLSEGTNQYFTEARANTAIDNRVTKTFVDNLAVVANIANVAYSVAGANVTGQVGNSLVAGTVYTAAQPNITSVGNLINLQLDSTQTPITANVGQIFWDTTEHTVTIGMENGVQQQVGLENYIYVKANSAITDGQAVMFVGANGQNILAEPCNTASAGFKTEYFIGIATQSIAHNSFGYITVFGLVHSLNTNSYNVGDILWVDNSTPGALTNVQPSAPNFRIQVAAVTKKSAGDGHIMVRPTPFVSLSKLTDVSLTSPVTGESLVLNSSNVWVNGVPNIANIAYSVAGANVSGYVPNANVANTAYSVSAANISGTVNLANYATTANSVAVANVSGIGNIATINLDGNASNILYGNGSFASAPVTYGNSNVAAYLPNYTGNIGASSISVTGTLSLSNIASLYVPGGSANYILKTDGSGTLSWVAPTSGGNANINGSNTQIFFNDANSTALGASANLTFNKSTNTLTTTNMVVSGTTNLGSVSNITVTGGSSNNFLKTDGSGTLSWASLPTTSVTVDAYTGNGVQVAYTLSATPTNANYTIVAVAGVMQPKSTYSVSGNVLTFTGAPPNSAPVEVTTINSGVSMPSGGGGGGTGLTYQGISANTTLVAGNAYIVNTSSANLTLTLPASSTLGDIIGIIDGTGNANSHEITVTGANIMGSNNDMVVNTSRAAFQIVYYNSTQGWLLTSV